MATRLRLVFMGSDPIALPLLEALAGEGADRVEIVGVFTQPDRPVGRGQKLTANGIKTWALTKALPVWQPEKFDEAARSQLEALRPDVALVMAYGHILRPAAIDTPRLGTLNLHTSLLPHYRGASPIQSAIASGETETGVSLMRIVPALDAGPVADVARVTIDPFDTALTVETKLAEASAALVLRNLAGFASGELVFVPQDEARATFCRKLRKEDGGLDFAADAAVLAARINGLYPWPTCHVEILGTPVKLGLADAVSPTGANGTEPGVVRGHDADGLLVSTGRGMLRLRRLQRPGGKMLPAPDFLRGFEIPPGTVLASTPLTTLVADRPLR